MPLQLAERRASRIWIAAAVCLPVSVIWASWGGIGTMLLVPSLSLALVVLSARSAIRARGLLRRALPLLGAASSFLLWVPAMYVGEAIFLDHVMETLGEYERVVRLCEKQLARNGPGRAFLHEPHRDLSLAVATTHPSGTAVKLVFNGWARRALYHAPGETLPRRANGTCLVHLRDSWYWYRASSCA